MERLIFPVTRKEAEKQGKPYSSKANKEAVFPTQLRELREKKGVSQAKIARDLGVSKSTIGLYETGDTLPDAKTLYDLATYFNVSADYLLGLSKIKTYAVHPRVACELTGLSDDAFKIIWALAAPANNSGNERLKDAMNAFLSNKKFVDLIMELKTCISESESVGCALSRLSSYGEDEFPSDPIELLNYARKKWNYKWESGERYYGFDAGFEVIKAEEKRGYSLYLCQTIFMEIIKELSEEKLKL